MKKSTLAAMEAEYHVILQKLVGYRLPVSIQDIEAGGQYEQAKARAALRRGVTAGHVKQEAGVGPYQGGKRFYSLTVPGREYLASLSEADAAIAAKPKSVWDYST